MTFDSHEVRGVYGQTPTDISVYKWHTIRFNKAANAIYYNISFTETNELLVSFYQHVPITADQPTHYQALLSFEEFELIVNDSNRLHGFFLDNELSSLHRDHIVRLKAIFEKKINDSAFFDMIKVCDVALAKFENSSSSLFPQTNEENVEKTPSTTSLSQVSLDRQLAAYKQELIDLSNKLDFAYFTKFSSEDMKRYTKMLLWRASTLTRTRKHK